MRNILIVDDEEMIVELYEHCISEVVHKDVSLHPFSDPRDAKTFIEDFKGHIDVAVLDMFMPKVSGFTLARALMKKNKKTTLVIVTGAIGHDQLDDFNKELHMQGSNLAMFFFKPTDMALMADYVASSLITSETA